MMSVFLSYLAEAFYSLNTSLVDEPPPGTELDVCYLGKQVTFCRDLEHGKKFSVGSWYISPMQHAREFCAVTSICLLVLCWTFPILGRYHPCTNNRLKAVRPPFPLKLVVLMAVMVQVYYKAQGYKGKIWFWLMPCNMNWLLLFFISFYPALSWQVSHTILQMCISFSGLAVVALVSPDVNDLFLPLEVPFFFISHAILAFFPLYFVVTQQISTLPSQRTASAASLYFVSWLLATCSIFGLFYFSVVTPLSIYSGLNLNYMLSPPPNQDIAVGPWYRFVSCASVGTVFFVMRFLATLSEWVLISIKPPSATKIE